MNNFYLLLLCISHFSVWYLSIMCSNFKWMKVVKTLKEAIKLSQKSIELSKENFDSLKKNFVNKDIVRKLEETEARLKEGK